MKRDGGTGHTNGQANYTIPTMVGGGQGNAKWNRIYAPNGHNNAPSLFFHNVYNNYNIIAQNTMPIAWNNKSS